jgi:hypothetical protein
VAQSDPAHFDIIAVNAGLSCVKIQYLKARDSRMLTNLTPQQRELAQYMSELSESAYSAGWMDGLEQALWRAVIGGPCRYGDLTLTTAHIQKLKALSDACGGWIRFDDEQDECFVPMESWIQLNPAE